MDSLKERIEKLMEVTGWSHTRVAAEAKLSKGSVTHWLNGATLELKGSSAANLSKNSGFNAKWLIDGKGPMMAGDATGVAVASIAPSHQTLEACLRTLSDHLAQLSIKGKVHAKLALSALVDDPEDVEGACATIQAQIGLANEALEIGRQPKFISSGK